MKNMKKGIALRAGFERLITLLLVLLLLFSLGACKKDKSDDEGINLVVGTGGEESLPGSDPASDENNKSETGAPGVNEFGQDLSGFPLEKDLVLMYPEYKDSINWNRIPRDYIGGLGDCVVPNESVETYVNIREKPSISAKVVGELHHGDEMLWWCRVEYYVDVDQLVSGFYKVSADGYTWTPVECEENNTLKTGWVALEMVDFWGV